MINSSEAIRTYPAHLPGRVLPNLDVTLEKLSLEYVYAVFMGIEIPFRLENDTTDVTIGRYIMKSKNAWRILEVIGHSPQIIRFTLMVFQSLIILSQQFMQ